MNIKVEDYLAHKEEVKKKEKILERVSLKRKEENKSRLLKAEDEVSKRLSDCGLSDREQAKDSKQVSEKGERIDTEIIEKDNIETGEAGMKKEDKNFKTISSNKDDLLNEVLESSDSFVAFSNRTSLTHAPTIYEEVIQKYENDIRNHIRIEQQMKLHSDSVINKLEDKEKSYDKACNKIKSMEDRLRDLETEMKSEARVLKEENKALRKSLDSKIEKILNLEMTLKESSLNFKKLEKEVQKSRKSKKYHSGGITPNINESEFKGKTLTKNKYKVNSANPNSGRKSSSNSVQLFYSRNIKGPNNIGREEFIIPATSTRSPEKYQGHIVNKSIIFQKNGKSPYIHGDLEKLKQYVNMPKSKTRKTIKSALRGKYLNTEGSEERKKIRDYNSMQNSIVYRGTKKEVDDYIGKLDKGSKKHSKIGKHKHFMSYDAKSNLKYYDFGTGSVMDNSMDKIHKRKKMSMSTKMKSKRNSSITKMFKAQKQGFMSNTSNLGSYGGVNVK